VPCGVAARRSWGAAHLQFPCDEVGDVPGVPADSANQRRGYPEQEREPNDIQAGLIEDGAALMNGLLVARKLRSAIQE